MRFCTFFKRFLFLLKRPLIRAYLFPSSFESRYFFSFFLLATLSLCCGVVYLSGLRINSPPGGIGVGSLSYYSQAHHFCTWIWALLEKFRSLWVTQKPGTSYRCANLTPLTEGKAFLLFEKSIFQQVCMKRNKTSDRFGENFYWFSWFSQIVVLHVAFCLSVVVMFSVLISICIRNAYLVLSVALALSLSLICYFLISILFSRWKSLDFKA